MYSLGNSHHSCTKGWPSHLPLGLGMDVRKQLKCFKNFCFQLSHISIWGSILSWFIFVAVYAQVWCVIIVQAYIYKSFFLLSLHVHRPTLPIGSEMLGLVRTVQHVWFVYSNDNHLSVTKDSRLFGTPVFYALIIIVPCIALTPDILYKM